MLRTMASSPVRDNWFPVPMGPSASTTFRIARSGIPNDRTLRHRCADLLVTLYREERVVKVQIAESPEFPQPFRTGVGHVGAIKAEPFEFRQATERLESFVADVRIIEVQIHKTGEMTNTGHASICEAGSDQTQLLEILELFKMMHRSVGNPRVVEQQAW